MKKLLFFFLTLVFFSSCDECYWCEPYHDYHYGHKWEGQDCFYADRLIGTWQCCYPMCIGNVEFKQIVFLKDGHADVTMAYVRDTQWFTKTYRYAYYGDVIRLYGEGESFSFTICSFCSPELMVCDSFGKYVWRYVRTA